MTPVPTADAAGVAPVRPPRPQRGFIASYGVGRVCAEPGCRTTLSRYNKTERCHPHAVAFEARLHRKRS